MGLVRLGPSGPGDGKVEIFTDEGRAARRQGRWGLERTGRFGRARRGRRVRGPGEADDCHGQPNHTENDQESPPELDEEPDHDESEEEAEGATPGGAGARASGATTFTCHAASSHLAPTICEGRSAQGPASLKRREWAGSSLVGSPWNWPLRQSAREVVATQKCDAPPRIPSRFTQVEQGASWPGYFHWGIIDDRQWRAK